MVLLLPSGSTRALPACPAMRRAVRARACVYVRPLGLGRSLLEQTTPWTGSGARTATISVNTSEIDQSPFLYLTK